ncbi:MAG TPA: FAD/NAD(P)-binding protein [Verrucomicrobiae bacterium]|nr:FAD/NAD(P)-binding protein [Verrucomicrobiae bacterium]
MRAQQELVADYVVVGAGAMGLAFVDSLLDHTDADVVLIDKRAEPGGHWQDAYPFVRLHNVSAVYGVNSRPLGRNWVESRGPEAGFMERASRADILEYYAIFFREKVLASGRVRWLPEHEWINGVARSLRDDAQVPVRARRRVVDATFTDTQIPTTHAPGFLVAPDVSMVTPNELPEMVREGGHFTIIGGGKTAMDCASFLLGAGIDPHAIAWVRPRDAWLMNRAYLQPNEVSFVTIMEGFAADQEAAAVAHSVSDYFARLEEARIVHRIDASVEPTMFRCAIASEFEISQWRRIANVIRMGRVREIDAQRMFLDHGDVQARSGEVYIHCAADGVRKREPAPVFQAERITLQYVRRCAPPLSAAFIARVEAEHTTDESKNALCAVVPMVEEPIDWVRTQLMEAANRVKWANEPSLRQWLETSRLDGYAALISRVMAKPTPAQAAAFARWVKGREAGLAGLRKLLEAPAGQRASELIACA